MTEANSNPPPGYGWRYRTVSPSKTRFYPDELDGHRFGHVVAFGDAANRSRPNYYQGRCSCGNWRDDQWFRKLPMARKRFVVHIALASRQGTLWKESHV